MLSSAARYLIAIRDYHLAEEIDFVEGELVETIAEIRAPDGTVFPIGTTGKIICDWVGEEEGVVCNLWLVGFQPDDTDYQYFAIGIEEKLRSVDPVWRPKNQNDEGIHRLNIDWNEME